MKKNINNQLVLYLIILSFFSVFYLFHKHNVGNDSTISEWIINYSGGFTKRGLVGEIAVWISNIFNLKLRFSIFLFQTFLIFTYFTLLYYFFKNIKLNKLMILSIFTPIFILYPVAEIEVLARKELFIFCIYIIYLNIQKIHLKNIYKIIFLPVAVLIWEPVVFFFPFWLAVDIINNKNISINNILFKNLPTFIPSILIAIYIALNPITETNHTIMVDFLKNNFNEECYMSCGLLLVKSSIYSQFESQFDKYSFEVFLRYFLIILIGFGPLFILTLLSKLKHKNLFFFKNFNNLFFPLLIILSPVIILFAMGYDWGRWVNISYVYSALFYFYLYKKKLLSNKKNY